MTNQDASAMADMTHEEIEKMNELTFMFHTSLIAQDGRFTITDVIVEAMAFGRKQSLKNVGMLRQWLNEDRITDPKKMVTSELLTMWLESEQNL